MWKWKKKRKAEETEEETPSSIEEQQADEEVSSSSEEITPADAELEKAKEAIEEAASSSEEITPARIEQDKVKEVIEETVAEEEPTEDDMDFEEVPFTEEEAPTGVFIFGNKIEGRFKKFLTTMFSIFLLPPTILFALLILTSVILLVFPLIAIVLPIILIFFCILIISLPVMIPFFTIVSLITDKGKVCFGFKNKKFAIKVLGITFPRHADR